MTFHLGRILAGLFGLFGVALLVPLAASVRYGEGRAELAFSVTLAVCALLGLALALQRRLGPVALNVRNAFLVVGGTWLGASALGALPYALHGALGGYVNAFFESVSGFTTTGASVCASVEDLPRSLLLWRALTQSLGGLGAVALVGALLPYLGDRARRLVDAETAAAGRGGASDAPSFGWAVAVSGLIYVGLTLAQTCALRALGLGWFDAFAHACATLSTGGFSTRTAGLSAFGSAGVEWVCTAFMALAAVNFALYRRLCTGQFRTVFRNSELRAFLVLAAGATAVVALVQSVGGPLGESFRRSAFQVVSVLSTTGFATGGRIVWFPASQVVLLALMLVGGCAGSAAGGVKVLRWTVLGKQLRGEFRRLLYPREASVLRLNGEPAPTFLMPSVAVFLVAYLALVLLTAFFGALAGLPGATAAVAALGLSGTVGPAPGVAFPALPAALKLWYAGTMLAGRLEIYALVFLAGRVCAAVATRTGPALACLCGMRPVRTPKGGPPGLDPALDPVLPLPAPGPGADSGVPEPSDGAPPTSVSSANMI